MQQRVGGDSMIMPKSKETHLGLTTKAFFNRGPHSPLQDLVRGDEIGTYFGRRSHSTVISAQKKIDTWMAKNSSQPLADHALSLE